MSPFLFSKIISEIFHCPGMVSVSMILLKVWVRGCVIIFEKCMSSSFPMRSGLGDLPFFQTRDHIFYFPFRYKGKEAFCTQFFYFHPLHHSYELRYFNGTGCIVSCLIVCNNLWLYLALFSSNVLVPLLIPQFIHHLEATGEYFPNFSY